MIESRGEPTPAVIDPVVAALRRGEVVVVPTDTVYGIAALPSAELATDRLFELKGRAARVPIAVLCADSDQALSLAEDPDERVRDIAAQHWPGPLTLVLRRHHDVDWDLGEPKDTIGVRVPDHALIHAITYQVGPIATTSANRHREPTPPTAVDVAKLFGNQVAEVVDGGPCPGTPSTVVDATDQRWKVLRQGELSLDLDR